MVNNRDIGNINGLKYRISGCVKMFPVSSDIKKKILKSIENIRMPLHIYRNCTDDEIWAKFKAKVIVKIENIFTSENLNPHTAKTLIYRVEEFKQK